MFHIFILILDLDRLPFSDRTFDSWEHGTARPPSPRASTVMAPLARPTSRLLSGTNGLRPLPEMPFNHSWAAGFPRHRIHSWPGSARRLVTPSGTRMARS